MTSSTSKGLSTRFAPSPTGGLHIGGARTALFCYLAAKATGGSYWLRIEDTDQARNKEIHVTSLLDGLAWLGLEHDGLVFQSERGEFYQEALEILLEKKVAYHCDCSSERLDALRESQKANKQTPKYDGKCRNLELSQSEQTVVRFNMSSLPESTLSFKDLLRGELEVKVEELDDFVLKRSKLSAGHEQGFTYNFCSPVDDEQMGINMVTRGDDHLRNTFKQVALAQALSHQTRQYCHLSMVLNQQGERLSKRHGAFSVLELEAAGLHPEALVDYIARLGWSHGDEEMFGLEKLKEIFSLEQVNVASSQFDMIKLKHLSGQYLSKASSNEIKQFLASWSVEVDTPSQQAIELFHGRYEDLQGLKELLDSLSSWSATAKDFESLACSQEQHLGLRDLLNRWQEVSDWTQEALEDVLKATLKANQLKFPLLAKPMRYLLSGSATGPSVGAIAATLGRDETFARLKVLAQAE